MAYTERYQAGAADADRSVAENTAEARYRALEQYRQPFLDRARECSVLTIPYLIPPDGWTGNEKLYTPFQSVGSRGVNNLSSKLLLSLWPVNTSVARMEMSEKAIDQAMQFDKKARQKVEEGLASIERKLMKKIRTSKVRPAFSQAFKHLIVGGNVLIHRPTEKNAKVGLRVFPLSRYVVCRDPMGNLLEIVVKEDVAPATIDPKKYDAIKALATVNGGYKGDDKTCSIFTCIKREETEWTYYQEIHGIRVPGSGGTYPLDKNPWLPIRWNTIEGEDYGRGYIEDYLGDLQSLEGLSMSMVQGSAAAAKVIFLTNPNGSTSAKDLQEAQSGDFKEGIASDVTVLQMEKFNDFRITKDQADTIERRLAFAFLLNSAIQRDAERVTAEEWRQMVQELEDALGGIYSLMSQELQLPFVTILLWEMEKSGELPKFPKGAVQPTIITGLEALGRGHDLAKLREFGATVQQILGQDAVARFLKPDSVISRVGTALSVETADLLKSEEELAQEAQQSQQQALIEKLGPNAINQMGALAKDGKLPGMEQAQQPAQAPTT